MKRKIFAAATFFTVAVCLMAAMVPWSSISAQLGKPGVRQPAAPPPEVALPDIASVVLYISPILLPGSIPGNPNLPSGVQGGREAEGRVTLRANAPASGAVIALLSGNTTLLRVPPTVTVPAGASSVKFRYDPLPVSEPTTATVSAVYNKLSKTGSVLILPPSIQTLTLDSLQLKGGNRTNGLVKLNGVGPADKDIKVTLITNHPSVQVPAEVILRGVQQKGFEVATNGVAQATAVLVSASFAGHTQQASLTVIPAQLSRFWVDVLELPICYPQGQSGSSTFTGKIRFDAGLSGPAPFDGGAAIQVTSSNAQLFPVPATLTVEPNAKSASIEVTCPTPTAESVDIITATYLGRSLSVPVTVKLLTLPDLTVRAVLYDAAGNAIAAPANPQPFKLCAAVDQGSAGTVWYTVVAFAYQHSRGFSQQLDLEINMGPGSSAQACRTVEGLEIGDYVDVMLTVDPANKTAESDENNNSYKLRVSR